MTFGLHAGPGNGVGAGRAPKAADCLLVWKVAVVGVGIAVAAVTGLVLLTGQQRLPPALVLLLAAVVGLFLLELVLTLISVVRATDVRLWRRGTPQVRVMLRLALLGRLVTRTDRDRLFRSFVAANNRLLRGMLQAATDGPGAPRVLLLAPTCLQAADCTKEITEDASLCERCGKCPVKDLVELAEERGLELHFVAGGTLARSLVETRAPDAIVAVACERELTEGILFSRKVPVLAVPNTRPKGPCKETQVDVTEVRGAVDTLGA